MEVEEIQANPNSTANTRSIGNGRIDDEDGGNKWQSSSSRIIRVSRATGGKDRHSKVWTSKGPRDRRVRLSVTTAIQFYDLQDRLGYDQPSKAVEWLISAASDAISELPSLNTSAFPKQDHNSSASETSKGSSVLSLSRSDVRVNRLKARQRARERASSTKDHKPQTTSSSFTELLNSNASSCPHQLDYFSSRPHHHFHMGTSLSLPMSMSVSVPPFGIGGVDVAASASLEFPFVAEQQQQSQPNGGGADFGGQSFWINRGTLQSNSSHNSSHFQHTHHHLQRLSNSANNNNNNNIDAHQHQFFAAADHQHQFSAAAAAFDARLHLCYADHKGKGKN